MSFHKPLKAQMVHGFNVTDPGRTIGKLVPYFETAGFETEMFRYGHLGLLGVRKRNLMLAKKLAQRCFRAKEEGFLVCVVCHSNGGTVSHQASDKYGAPMDVVVMINPALKATLRPCPTAGIVHVYHNYADMPTMWAKWLRRISPGDSEVRPWGEMGREGYRGDDMNVFNFDTANDFRVPAKGHSGVFRKTEFFGPKIVSKTAGAIAQLEEHGEECPA